MNLDTGEITISGADQWTPTVRALAGTLMMEAQGSATCLLTLEHSPDGITFYQVKDLDVGDSNGKYSSAVGGRRISTVAGTYFRLGCRPGDFTSGSAKARLYG